MAHNHCVKSSTGEGAISTGKALRVGELSLEVRLLFGSTILKVGSVVEALWYSEHS